MKHTHSLHLLLDGFGGRGKKGSRDVVLEVEGKKAFRFEAGYGLVWIGFLFTLPNHTPARTHN